MKLTEVSYDRIRAAGMAELYELSEDAGIQDDDRLVHSDDLRERLILLKRKMEGSNNTWKHLFQSVQEETKVKSESLMDLMRTVEASFQMCHIKSLSEILRKEGYLQSRDLLQEISVRMKNLLEQRSLVIIAGETNGGKSTFINLLLGEDILPTDVLHCTFAVCKIVYSETYSLKTVDYEDQVENFPNLSREKVKAVLKSKVAQEEMEKRIHGSPIKEITLGLPADILKSGVTLVDTPGIGEDENMDNVTMNFVKSTHASAFIYIIKSDTAGGLQEDRLLSFLRAIKERYSSDAEVESFDPRAAMFVCHRWDNIELKQRDNVKQNALSKLEYVWPGFEPSQIFFFSTTDTMKHLPVDPDFVTDSFMLLLKGLKHLFERASHNAIKHQYIWLKYLLQPASRHLRSMITHCIHNNDELEMYFKNVAVKQNTLNASSKENSEKLQNELNALSLDLQEKILSDLSFDNTSECHNIPDYKDIKKTWSKENFLFSKSNIRMLDEMIIKCLLKYVDDQVQKRNIVTEMESKILTAIKEHLGLFESQITHIKNAMQHGGHVSLASSSSRSSLEDFGTQLRSSTASSISMASDSSEVFSNEKALDTTRLASMINSLLLRRKSGKSGRSIYSKHELQESLLSKMRSKIKHALFQTDPDTYIEERVRKIANDMREDQMIMDSIVNGFTEWIQGCVTYAKNSIPKFIEVNNQLMDEIREHRSVFQKNKDTLRKIMEELEPIRQHLRGYGLLYMDDINAETLAFNVEQRNSRVFIGPLVAEHKQNDDIGFHGSGSRKKKVLSLWAKMQGAIIKINNTSERVVVKTYIYDMDEKVVLSEIAMLRCLEHTNLAPFLGMTRIVAIDSTRGNDEISENHTEKVSAFIFKGNLISANVYSKRKMTNMQLFVPQFVHSLLEGLNYIHRENLVHMEMNLDTVMVERDSGIVKLCQMCKPREARFPASLNTITRSCVCLSPNVLQGHEYESTDDMYAFGLLLWELLFPDDPPYREQRVWPLKRFMKECHPTNMLQEALMKLDVSDRVCDVLRGTLLVSRKSVCLSLATVQSLLVDISDEPAIQSLRSRNEQPVIRRKVLDLTIPETTQAHLEVPKKSPTRPPRRKDKAMSYDLPEPEIVIDPIWFPAKSSRRQTEPAIVITPPPSKNKFTKLLSGLFGHSSKAKQDEEIDESEDKITAYLKKDRRQSSPMHDDVDYKLLAPPVVEFSTSQVKSKIIPRNLKKQSKSDSKTHLRRLSLQEGQSFVGHKRGGSLEDNNFDVPSLMSKKYSSNLGSTFPKNKEYGENLLPSSQSDSVLLASWSSSRDTKFYRNQRPSSFTSSNLESGYGADRSADGSIILKFRERGDNVSGNALSTSTKMESVRLESSLQNVLHISKSQTSPTVRTILKDKLEAGTIHAEHGSHLIQGQRLGRSLQNVSEVGHAMGPILEDSVDTSSSESPNNFGNTYINHHFKRNILHHRWSPPTVPRSRKIPIRSSLFSSTSKEEVNLDSSPGLVSSSKPTVTAINGLCTDIPGKKLASIDDHNVKLSPDSQICSKFQNSKLEKQNNIEHIPVNQNRNPATSEDNFSLTTLLLKRHTQTDMAKGNNNLSSDSRETIVPFFDNNSRKRVNFSIGDTAGNSSTDSDKYDNSLSSSTSGDSGQYNYSLSSHASVDHEVYDHPQSPYGPNTMLVPPPAPINFSKLSFGKDYDSDSDSE